MALSALDQQQMAQALGLAAQAIGVSDPNPRVGCVIATPAGQELGAGFTQAVGGPHAEAEALRDARHRGHNLGGATAFVTLEPCSHQGRTPPCCAALVDAGIGRVVVAALDPNPLVNGQGVDHLRRAGVSVEMASLEHRRQAVELNIGFFSRMLRGRPWLRMKVAASLDGKTALLNGKSQWITGEPARVDGHEWRKRASAVLTGIGTVLEDDPQLDVRWVSTCKQPARIVVDSQLQLPVGARVLAQPEGVTVFCAAGSPEKRALLTSLGVTIIEKPGTNGKVDLHAMLADLGAIGINELHVEAGEKLNASLMSAGLVDELLVYLAPRIFGAGRGMASIGPFQDLAEATQLKFMQATLVGDDLRLLARAPAAPWLDPLIATCK